MVNAGLRAMISDIDFVVQTLHVIGKNQVSFNQVLVFANGTRRGPTIALADATARMTEIRSPGA